MTDISDMPILCGIYSDYITPVFKLASPRHRIVSGEYREDVIPPASPAPWPNVSIQVTCSALVTLASRYVSRPGNLRSYIVIWRAKK